jgi:hypothetical protein
MRYVDETDDHERLKTVFLCFWFPSLISNEDAMNHMKATLFTIIEACAVCSSTLILWRTILSILARGLTVANSPRFTLKTIFAVSIIPVLGVTFFDAFSIEAL